MALTISAETSISELLPLFPDQLGQFKRVGMPRPLQPAGEETVLTDLDQSSFLVGMVDYRDGKVLGPSVQIVRFHQDADAYTMLTMNAAAARNTNPDVEINNQYGTASFSDGNVLRFFKGVHFVKISGALKSKELGSDVRELARLLSDSLDKGEGEVPALVKHLPNFEDVQKRAVYLNRFASVKSLAPTQAVLDVLQTDRDADAAFAETGKGKVLVVEYHTPQLAKENDERVIAKIHELWKLGQPAPIGYKRVGNYSVFVFDAADDATAKELIGQVHYEQLVQWLGHNP